MTGDKGGVVRGTAAPEAAVVLVCHNAWEHVLECLESLLRMRYPAFRVVVCDNDSSDGSVERILAWTQGRLQAPAPADPRYRARVEPPVPKPVSCAVLTRDEAEAGGGEEDTDATVVVVRTGANAGFSAGNNVALRYVLARGIEYAWVLNPDTVVAPEALAALVATAEADPAVGMVGGKLLYYHGPERVQAAAGGRLVRWNGMTHLAGDGAEDGPEWDREPPSLDYVHGACLLVRAELLREVGLLDEAYFIYSEEVDWCLRAVKAGWKLAYAPGCRVWHKEGGVGGGKRSPFSDYHGVRSRLILLRKHYPLLFPLGVVHTVWRCLLPKVVRRQPERLRAVLYAYHDFVRRAPARVRP